MRGYDSLATGIEVVKMNRDECVVVQKVAKELANMYQAQARKLIESLDTAPRIRQDEIMLQIESACKNKVFWLKVQSDIGRAYQLMQHLEEIEKACKQSSQQVDASILTSMFLRK